MTEPSTGTHRAPAVTDPWSVPPAYRVPRPLPRVMVKADLLPSISVVGMATLLAFPLAWLWALLAPSQRMRVFPGNQLIPLDLESWHRFDALAIYGFLSLGLGVLVGAVVWLLRERRGPVILVAAVIGSAAASLLGQLMASGFAAGRYTISRAPALGDVIQKAPTLETWWVFLAAPMATVVVYGILAAWNGQDDLGRRLG